MAWGRSRKRNPWDIAKALGGIAFIGGVLVLDALTTSPEDRKRKAEFKRLSGKVLRRARFRCESCGQRRELKVYYIVDPRQGGECTYDNLQALCKLCHAKS